MTVRTPDSGLESLEHRYESIMRWVLPILVLVVPLIPVLADPEPDRRGVRHHGRASPWRRAPGSPGFHPASRLGGDVRWLMRLYCLGLLAFIVALTVRSPWYGFFTWSASWTRSGT